MDDWDQSYARDIRRAGRANRLRALMIVVIVTSALGALVVILWLLANRLLSFPVK